MSSKSLSRMDHTGDAEDMQYLIQPRGPGTGWVFRMVTPPELVGKPNPWTGKEIKKGLKTRRLPEARKLRDVALGDVRKLAFENTDADLLPAGPSVITRVCGFEIGSWTGRFGQARLAWSLQIAQAPG
ncbi:MAG: hypothetical protein ACJASC_001958, partial [Limimaricola cinnabarinus]